jgi:ankyrin repeat protein
VCGEVDALEALLDAGAVASSPDIHGGYPIHYAAQMCGVNSEMGNNPQAGLAVLRILLARSVDVHVKDKDGRQPILWAASAGKLDIIYRNETNIFNASDGRYSHTRTHNRKVY